MNSSKAIYLLLAAALLAGTFLTGCAPPEPAVEAYTGEAEGGHGPVVVEVTMEDGTIVDIEVVEHTETEGLGDVAFEKLIPEIIERGSTEGIDVHSGATVSSEALFDAVNEALQKAQ